MVALWCNTAALMYETCDKMCWVQCVDKLWGYLKFTRLKIEEETKNKKENLPGQQLLIDAAWFQT